MAGLLALSAAVSPAVSIALPTVAAAQATATMLPRFASEEEAQRFMALTSELRCVMCQNQSLADSDARIAHDLRREVLELMRQGRSDAEIKAHLVERYGEFVLYQPRVAPHTWLLWFGPLLLLAGGGLLVWRIVRGRARGGDVPPDDGQEW
ncbi:cytochrome c-type biogenesis protein [Luteimonas pelagia]